MERSRVHITRVLTRPAIAAVVMMLFALTACTVDEPAIEGTQASTVTATAVQGPTAAPLFQPTVAPPEATVVPDPTPVPTATEVPEPTPTPTPTVTGPTPLPTLPPADNYDPSTVAAGPVAIPVRGATFMLATDRPVLQLSGHTLIYVDDELNAEVDIFTPAAQRDGTPLPTYDSLLTYLSEDAALAGLEELDPVTIAGHATRVFEGTADSAEAAFVTELAAVGETRLGWFPPARMRLWVIDHPAGPVIVSAESLENPGRYSEAVRLATEVLSTIDFG